MSVVGYAHHSGFEDVDVWTFLLGETISSVCSLLQVCMIFGEKGKVISIINIFKLGEEIPLDASGFVTGGILHGPVSGSDLCNYLRSGNLSFLNVKAFIFSLSPSHKQTWGPLYFYKFYLMCLSLSSFSDSSSFFLSKGFHLLASLSTSVQNTILPVLHFSFHFSADDFSGNSFHILEFLANALSIFYLNISTRICTFFQSKGKTMDI